MRKALIILLCVVLLVGAGAVALHRFGLRVYGPGYDPNNSSDVQKLGLLVDGSRPLREALERFRHENGGYPGAATNLFPSYLQAQTNRAPYDWSDWAGWNYCGETSNSYTLIQKVNWDDGMSFDRLTNGAVKWSYFTSVTNTDLTPAFQQR
jgi:hypothetical protein